MTKFRQTLKKFVIIRAIKDLPGIKSAYIFFVYRLMRRPLFSRRLTIRAAPATQALVGADSRQQVDFYEHDQADAMNAIEPLKDKERYFRVSRPQVCLDDFCAEKQVWPDIVKIDVEGAEVQVLRGAKDMLRKARPVVYLSVHPRRIELLGDTKEDLRGEVAAAGYEITDFNGQSATTLEFGEYLLVPHKV